MGIPSILNIPGPVKFIQDFGLIGVPKMTNAYNWFGMLILYQDLKQWFIQLMLNYYIKYPKDTYKWLESWDNRLVMF